MTATSRPVAASRPDNERSDGPFSDAGQSETPAIRVASEGSTVVITVAGTLDVPEGDLLVKEAEAAVAAVPSRLEIDLRGLESYTDKGAKALVACRAFGARLPEGLHYRTGRGPGRDALLAAYEGGDGADM